MRRLSCSYSLSCLFYTLLHENPQEFCYVPLVHSFQYFGRSPLLGSGFVLLLEVLEKPWNLILDFKGT